jgi:tRNA(Ile)-lysidine synthase
MRMARFLRQLSRVIADHQLARAGDGVVLAVSGEPDSVALLHGLAGANAAFKLGLRLHVAHLNHLTRGADSNADATFVAAEASRLGVPATIDAIDVPGALSPGGTGFERAARNIRYKFLAGVARVQNCRLVATGHHADDNAETILHRIIRGTGPRGLAGIRPVRPLAADAVLDDGTPIMLIRPLLFFRRRAIERVLTAAGLPYRTDASNLLTDPLRNWLRHELIPLLARSANPGVVGSLLRLGELSGWVNAFLEETAARTLASLVVDRTDARLSLNAVTLAGKSEIIQAELIRQAVISLGPREAEIGLRHLKAVMRLAGDGQSGKQVNLPGGMSASRQGGLLILSQSSAGADGIGPATDGMGPAAGEVSLSVAMPGRTALPRSPRQLVIELLSNEPGLLARFRAGKTRDEELIDADQLRPPLVLRRRRPGDRFCPLGAGGAKKVADFLSDQKVPPMDRDRIWLLCDRLGPVWLVGLRIDDRVRVTELSRNLAKLIVKED